MKTGINALLAAAAMAAMTFAAASPALAGDGFGHGSGWDRGHGWDRGGWDRGGWDRSGNPRRAVDICSRVAERSVRRQGYDRANVFDIRDVRDTRWGYEVRGRLEVREHGGWHGGWRGDRHGWGGHDRFRDTGSFRCRFERGRVVALDIDGIRGF